MPVCRKYQLGNGLTVGVWKIEETPEQLRGLFHHFALYESAYNRFHSDKRKLEWLAVRALLKEMLGEEKEIAYLPSGKPYLTDRSMHVSFSHTRGYVAVALHSHHPVAVDIEQYGTKVCRVAHKFIREDERVSINAGDEIYALLLHWSAKETMYKLLDTEGVDFIDHLHIVPFLPSEDGAFTGEEYVTGQYYRFLIHYRTHPDYVLTFAVDDASAAFIVLPE